MFRRLLCAILICLVASCSTVFAQTETKLPIPEEANQMAAMKEIKGIFGDLLKSEEDSREKLTRDILVAAEESKEATEKYALLMMAIELSTDLGDPLLYREILETMTTRFDGWDSDWVDAYPAVVKKTPKDQATEVHEVYGFLIDLCVKHDDFVSANRLARAGAGYIRLKDKSLSREAIERSKALRLMHAEYRKVEASFKALDANPKDKAASSEVGKYYCFIKGDWEKGLKLLAQGDDAAFRGLAEIEAFEPSEAKDQVELADHWMKLAEKHKAYEAAIHTRAAMWYEKALPNLTGLQAIKVTNTLKKLEQSSEPKFESKRKAKGIFLVNVDENADIYINGKKVMHVPTYRQNFEAKVQVAMGDIVVIVYQNLNGPGGVTLAFAGDRFSFATKTDQWVLLPEGTPVEKINLRMLQSSKDLVKSVNTKQAICDEIFEKTGVMPQTIEVKPNRGKFIIATVITKNSLVKREKK